MSPLRSNEAVESLLWAESAIRNRVDPPQFTLVCNCSGKILTGSVIESPGLPGCVATQPSFYQFKDHHYRIVHCFAHDLPTLKIVEPSDVSRPTINRLLFKLRTRIAQLCDASSPFSGEVEVDESYFAGCRVRGKKGRGAGGKMIVFGILERHGRVHTEIVPNAAKKPL